MTFLPDSGEPNAYGMWWSWRLWTFQVSQPQDHTRDSSKQVAAV